MGDGISRAEHRGLLAEELPGQADARLDGGLVELNTDAPIAGDANATGAFYAPTRKIKLSGRYIEVGLALGNFGFGCRESPTEANVYSQIRSNPPIILHEGTEELPATAGFPTQEGLIVGGETVLAEEQVGHGISGGAPAVEVISVLVGIGEYVHLIGTEGQAYPDVVLAPDHVEGVPGRINVRSPLVRSVGAITHGVVTTQLIRSQTAADTFFRGLVQAGWDAGGFADGGEIGARNTDARPQKISRFAAASAVRKYVIENAIKTEVELVDSLGGKDVSFGNHRIAPVVRDVLRASEGVLLREAGRTPRNQRICLIVAETAEHGVFAGEIVVQSDVACALVKPSHGH